MLQRIDFITDRGEELSLVVGDVSSGVILTEVAGLDPVKATLVSTNFAMRDGTKHQAARRESRDLIVRMSLDSRFSGVPVSQMRQELYKMFMSKTPLDMIFVQDDHARVQIKGIVEDVAAERFTKTPTFAMSIHCNDPDFISTAFKLGTGEGYATTMVTHPVEYNGTVDSGIEFEIDINGTGTATGFILQQVTPSGQTRRLIFDAPIANSDTLFINTHPGQKSATRRRAGNNLSILYGIDPQSQWPILEPGINQIGVQVTGGTYQSYYQYLYYERYGAL